MALVENFLKAVDRRWTPVNERPITLQLIGSAALMLQSDYSRGTKDGDVLESRGDSSYVNERLLALGGPGTDLHKETRLYIDVVRRAILFLPQKPIFHQVPIELTNFQIEVLDIEDVVVSKLKRFSAQDVNDIRAMAHRNLLDHSRLVKRFEAAADRFALDARAADVGSLYLKNLRTVEKEILATEPLMVDLPDECAPN